LSRGWRDALPAVRGRLRLDEPLGPFTWFRVGGPAEVLFLPADAADLANLLRVLPPDVPRTVIGVGSNLIVRDGGIEGLVIRLAGRTFAAIEAKRGSGRLVAGAGALDSSVARAAAESGIGGLEFLAGIPGTVGGALTMNAGCYGVETKDVLIRAWGLDQMGRDLELAVGDFGYAYRASAAPVGAIWLGAEFQGRPDDPEAIRARIGEITTRREATQPIREKTGGSTFKNPAGHSAWKLVDEAGWRGRELAGAMMSPLHANFMINKGGATAANLEALGEAVRADVRARLGVQLDWEIRRIGRAARAESR
jgi:UDP-N-acetylmuramate dehydrogenase